MSSSSLRSRLGALALVLLGALSARPAQGAVQGKLQPAFTLAGGADDNLLFNNQGQGDVVGRTGLRLHGKLYDRHWAVGGDLGVSVYGFADQQRLVFLGESTLAAQGQPARHDKLLYRLRLRGADDPLALAQIGLLGGQGRTFGFRSMGEWEHRFDPRWSSALQLSFDGVRFLEPAQATRSGEALGVAALGRYRLTRPVTLSAGLEGRTFLGDEGVVANALTALPGMRLRLTRRTYLEAAGGPALYFDDHGSVWMPVARLSLQRDWRQYAFTVNAMNDLAVPTSRGGVMAGQVLEAVGRYGTTDVELRVRGGYYRSHPSPRDDRWVPGYGVEAGAFYRVFGYAWLGVTALRFERLPTLTEPSLARDAVYLRLDLTPARP